MREGASVFFISQLPILIFVYIYNFTFNRIFLYSICIHNVCAND